MMTAENKISPRQLRRMLFIEMFGAGALSVPALACYNGQSGGVAVLFYGIFLIIATVVFYILSEKIQEQFSENAKSYAEILPKSIQSIYFIRFAINVAALFYFFGETIQTVYMPKSSFLFILFPAALLLWYTLNTNLQKRARFLELIFPWIFVSYGIAVFLSFVGIETSIQPEP
ncbi:MAG: GerAB/ArcD/ProY family transporter [Anaerobutyricum sp.]